MGASSPDRFDDDDEADWLADFADRPSISLLDTAFAYVNGLEGEDYLELPQCGAAIVAAEIVAAMRGKPHPGLPEDVMDWVAEQQNAPVAELARAARKALDRVKTNSEAQEIWAESDAAEEWVAGITALEKRLE